MLLVEKLADIVPFEGATGYKAVSINEPFFMGAFPPPRPDARVLIVEAMAETGGRAGWFTVWADKRPRPSIS